MDNCFFLRKLDSLNVDKLMEGGDALSLGRIKLALLKFKEFIIEILRIDKGDIYQKRLIKTAENRELQRCTIDVT